MKKLFLFLLLTVALTFAWDWSGGSNQLVIQMLDGGVATAEYLTVNSGSSTSICCGFGGASKSSSVKIDSIHLVLYTDQNDVYLDSVALIRGTDLGQSRSTEVLWASGTNYGQGSATYVTVKYNSINQQLTTTTRFRLYVGVATAGAAGSGRFYTVIAFCTYI